MFFFSVSILFLSIVILEDRYQIEEQLRTVGRSCTIQRKKEGNSNRVNIVQKQNYLLHAIFPALV